MKLITGSSGMIGTALCEELIKTKEPFIGLDRRKNDWNAEINKCTVSADLVHPLEKKIVKADVDCIVHLAANARVFQLVENPDLALENLLSVYNALEYARKNDISKFFFASSREVYGNAKTQDYSEENVKIQNCESPYASSKITGETLAHAYSNCYGIKILIYRFSNVYGRCDISDRVIPLFIRNARKNNPIKIFGNDKMLDFTYIDDATNMIMAGLEMFDKTNGKTYNVGTGEGRLLTDLAKIITQKLGSRSQITVENNRPGEVVRYVANIKKLKTDLGKWPQINLEDGLTKSIEWYKKNGS